MQRAAKCASGSCIDNLNGTVTVSMEWLHDYSRLLLQQACAASLRSLGTPPLTGCGTREAVEQFLTPNRL